MDLDIEMADSADAVDFYDTEPTPLQVDNDSFDPQVHTTTITAAA